MALLWVGMEATTLALAPLVYHRHDRRSLEAVWKYLLLSSVGIALALLGTFFLAAAQTTGRPLLLEDLIAGSGSAAAGAAAGRVHLPPGRLRHQDGPGAAALVEARHLRRGAQPGRGAHGGRPDELRVPRARAHHRDHDGRRAGGVRAAAARGVRRHLAGGRGGVHDRPVGPQADAGLLERRAHGPPGARPGAGRRRPVRGGPSPRQQRADQGAAVPRGRQRRAGDGLVACGRRARHSPARPGDGRAAARSGSSPSPARRRSGCSSASSPS